MGEREGTNLASDIPARQASTVHCILPPGVPRSVHQRLERFFAADPEIDVIVERRRSERREGGDRRNGGAGRSSPECEQRRIRNRHGRRVGDRRAPTVAVDPPPLPPGLSIPGLEFVERVLPSREYLEDHSAARLVTRFQTGQLEAVGELYALYIDRVYGYLRVILDDPHEAEDLVQQVFVKVMEALPEFEIQERPFRAWLFRIARNQALDRQRQRRRVDVEAPGSLDRLRECAPDSSAEEELDAEPALLEMVERLPLAQRQVIALRYALDLNASEIAGIMSLNRNHVYQLQSRALRRIEQTLAPRHAREAARHEITPEPARPRPGCR